MIVSTSAMGHTEPFNKIQQVGRGVSPELQNLILSKLSDPRTSAQDLLAMAELCQREGATETAKALRARAAEKTPAPRTGNRPQATSNRPPVIRDDAAGLALPARHEPASRETASVLPGVSHDRWMAFEKAMVRQAPGEIEPSGRLGMFAMAPRRLVDLGIVAETAKGPDGKWAVSKWAEGWSAEKFLGDPKVQQKAFRKSMREYARTIGALYKEALGKKVLDKPVTLSGLLAVAHVAGARGLGSWLGDKGVREKFPQTTRVFVNTTEMF